MTVTQWVAYSEVSFSTLAKPIFLGLFRQTIEFIYIFRNSITYKNFTFLLLGLLAMHQLPMDLHPSKNSETIIITLGFILSSADIITIIYLQLTGTKSAV